MRPDKHKKKDFLKADHSRCDFDSITKSHKIHQIKNEEKLDELPSKGKNNLAYRGQYISNAVDRFLRQNIGNNWDDVYSELVKRVDHFDGLKYRVDINAFELDGKIVSNGFCGTQEVRGFYVLNGILGEKQRPKRKRNNDKVHITFADGFVIFKHNDLFFKAPVDKSNYGTVWVKYACNNYSQFEKNSSCVKYTVLENRKRVKRYIDSKHIRQLNSKELKRWELPNTDING